MLYEKFSKAVRPKLIAETEFLGDVDFMAALKDWYQRQKDAGKDLAQLGLPDEAQKILENIKATNLERTSRRRSCARAIRDVGAASGEIQN